MARLQLAVYAANHVYLERFVSFVSQKNELGFQVQGFTDLSLLEKYLQKKKIDAVLLVLDEASKQAFKGNSGFIALLNRIDGIVIMMGRQHGCSEWDAFFKEEGYEGRIRYINRFQSAAQILCHVRSCFPEVSQEPLDGEETSLPWLAGMYSPVDKICHPQAAAAIMNGRKKVLYINLEQFSELCDTQAEESEDSIGAGQEAGEKADPGFGFRFGKEPGTLAGTDTREGAGPGTGSGISTISDVLYCYKQTPGKLQEVLNRIIKHRYGMDVLLGPEDLADLEELSEKDWPVFLRALARAGNYHYIFLDMSVFEWKLIDIVLSYGDLYIPALPYDPEKTFRSVLMRKDGPDQGKRNAQAAKMRAFRQFFIERGMQEHLQKIREVYLET